jgi:hypothetical protein
MGRLFKRFSLGLWFGADSRLALDGPLRAEEERFRTPMMWEEGGLFLVGEKSAIFYS